MVTKVLKGLYIIYKSHRLIVMIYHKMSELLLGLLVSGFLARWQSRSWLHIGPSSWFPFLLSRPQFSSMSYTDDMFLKFLGLFLGLYNSRLALSCWFTAATLSPLCNQPLLLNFPPIDHTSRQILKEI